MVVMQEIRINPEESQQEDKKGLIESFLTEKWLELSFLYTSDFKSAKILRDYIQMICETLKIENKWKSRLILITDELNNNAIEYGSLSWENNTMRISIKKENTYILLSIEVEDTGKWSSSKKAEDMEKLRTEKVNSWFKNHASIRGRWLFMIITNLVDRLYFKDSEAGGLIVWIEKKL